MIDQQLLDLLACPACDDRPPLRQEADMLVCDRCRRRYPINDGIPEVLVESAILPEGEPRGSTVQLDDAPADD
jgi:uncharacterized protein